MTGMATQEWAIGLVCIPMPKNNDPARKGELASRKVLFGDHHRYALFAVHTRFDELSWFVTDAEIIDNVTGKPAVIRQEDSPWMALDGLVPREKIGMAGY